MTAENIKTATRQPRGMVRAVKHCVPERKADSHACVHMQAPAHAHTNSEFTAEQRTEQTKRDQGKCDLSKRAVKLFARDRAACLEQPCDRERIKMQIYR